MYRLTWRQAATIWSASPARAPMNSTLKSTPDTRFTPNGTCIRDYIHVSDLIASHRNALAHLRAGGPSATLNCGYGRGFSVLEVIESVKRVSGVDFKVDLAGRRAGDPEQLVAA